MDFILGWVENNNSVLVCDIHHIVALFCSYLPETYSSSLTYSQARWSKRETWLWLVYLFHWFVLCFALPFPCSWRPTLLYIRLCIPIWKGPGNVITGHSSWVLRMNKAPPGGLGLHIDLEWERFLGIFRTAIWIRLCLCFMWCLLKLWCLGLISRCLPLLISNCTPPQQICSLELHEKACFTEGIHRDWSTWGDCWSYWVSLEFI